MSTHEKGNEILKALVELKRYKDKRGKDSIYEMLQPVVWQKAFEWFDESPSEKEDSISEGEVTEEKIEARFSYMHNQEWKEQREIGYKAALEDIKHPETEQYVLDQYHHWKSKMKDFGFNDFVHSKEVDQYRAWLRNDKYKHRLEWFEKKYPHGLYYKEEDGREIGINILTKSFLAEADAAYKLDELEKSRKEGRVLEVLEDVRVQMESDYASLKKQSEIGVYDSEKLQGYKDALWDLSLTIKDQRKLFEPSTQPKGDVE